MHRRRIAIVGVDLSNIEIPFLHVRRVPRLYKGQWLRGDRANRFRP